jgi:hypothetical protein
MQENLNVTVSAFVEKERKKKIYLNSRYQSITLTQVGYLFKPYSRESELNLLVIKFQLQRHISIRDLQRSSVLSLLISNTDTDWLENHDDESC